MFTLTVNEIIKIQFEHQLLSCFARFKYTKKNKIKQNSYTNCVSVSTKNIYRYIFTVHKKRKKSESVSQFIIYIDSSLLIYKRKNKN